jgi:hypothetical protein
MAVMMGKNHCFLNYYDILGDFLRKTSNNEAVTIFNYRYSLSYVRRKRDETLQSGQVFIIELRKELTYFSADFIIAYFAFIHSGDFSHNLKILENKYTA